MTGPVSQDPTALDFALRAFYGRMRPHRHASVRLTASLESRDNDGATIVIQPSYPRLTVERRLIHRCSTTVEGCYYRAQTSVGHRLNASDTVV